MSGDDVCCSVVFGSLVGVFVFSVMWSELLLLVGIAKSAFTSLEKVLKSRDIKLHLRIRVLKCYVWSTLLYGSETWILTSDLMKQLEATEMWFLRIMLRISYKDRVTNEEVLRRTKVDRTLTKDIVTRQI